MKLLITICTLLLNGCSQLMNGQIQPVVVKDANKAIMATTCSGSVEDWGTCNSKAKQKCPNGYIVLDKTENIVGGRRELTFQCKK